MFFKIASNPGAPAIVTLPVNDWQGDDAFCTRIRSQTWDSSARRTCQWHVLSENGERLREPPGKEALSKHASGMFVAERPKRAKRVRIRDFALFKIASNPSTDTIRSG